ncbi:YeeE/YedE family protein [Flavobacteriaceae bacterium R38]|nr:YeeE/YedE family protein [Flavobacteriaceae bacterium R38]
MKSIIYVLIGVIFGIVLFKSEAASWFRIYEMFQFGSFHMYGIIGSAVALGILTIKVIKRRKVKSIFGEEIKITPKNEGFKQYIFGGIIFGLGWALAGACPGPMFVLFGAGFMPILIVILASILGTYVYGLLKDKLPH